MLGSVWRFIKAYFSLTRHAYIDGVSYYNYNLNYLKICLYISFK